jgi:hypothetical protein
MMRNRIHPARWLALALGLVIALPAAAAAQQGPPEGRGQNRMSREEMEARIRETMARRIQEDLGLADEEMQALQEAMRPFEEQRRRLARREGATRLRVQAFLADGGREGEAEELISTLVDIRRQELELFVEEEEALAELLDPDQRLRFLMVRDQLNQRIQRARWQNGGARPPRPPGGMD